MQNILDLDFNVWLMVMNF